MILAEGTRVKLKYTGDQGVVTELLDHDMVQVLLDDGDEIPVAIDDLVRPADIPGKKPSVKAQIIDLPPPPKPTSPSFPEATQQYTILKSMGIQLAFLPVTLPDGMTEHYKMYLINDTQYQALFTFSLLQPNSHSPKINDKLDSESAYYLGDLPFNTLNDHPEVDVECWQITTAGTGKRLHKQFKIRAKQFFKNVLTAPILNKQVHHYRLFESFDPPTDTKEENLKAYTKRNVRVPRRQDSDLQYFSPHEVAAYAAFEAEIDLHIENLTTKDWRKMSNAEILHLQLQAFENYLEKGIQLGVERFFVIHGLGKGRLRDEIATRLMKHPAVLTFKNEYHASYGYGATEVILG